MTSVRSDSSSSGKDSKVVSIGSLSINEYVKDDSTMSEVINSNGGNKDISSTNLSDIHVITPSTHVLNDHLSSSIIGEISSGITTRKKEHCDYAKIIANIGFTSQIKPASVTEALKDDQWIVAMQEKLLQFE